MIANTTWTEDRNGSLCLGSYHIEQARVGLTWELWRVQDGRVGALGTGSRSDLQDRAVRMMGVNLVDETSEWVQAYLARVQAPRPTLSRRFAAWLNS